MLTFTPYVAHFEYLSAYRPIHLHFFHNLLQPLNETICMVAGRSHTQNLNSTVHGDSKSSSSGIKKCNVLKGAVAR